MSTSLLNESQARATVKFQTDFRNPKTGDYIGTVFGTLVVTNQKLARELSQRRVVEGVDLSGLFRTEILSIDYKEGR